MEFLYIFAIKFELISLENGMSVLLLMTKYIAMGSAQQQWCFRYLKFTIL